MEARDAAPEDLEPLAQLWCDGWRDGHEAIVPAALVSLRTLENFRDRMDAALPDVRVLGPIGAPLAFHLIKGDELNQFYVSAAARGTGTAAALMADAEARLAAAGVATAWLSCAIGNERAARFYAKSGWLRAGVMTDRPQTAEGPFELKTWRYEKGLAR